MSIVKVTVVKKYPIRFNRHDNYKMFTGLIIEKDNVKHYIDYPFKSSMNKHKDIVKVVGQRHNFVEFSNIDFARHRLDMLEKEFCGDDGMATSEPSDLGFWDDNGTLMYYNGTSSSVVDFNEGELKDVFGNPVGTDQ